MAGIDILTLALARRYTNEAIDGLGVMKGAPCTVESVVDNGQSCIITLRWVSNDGAEQTTEFEIRHGLGVSDMVIDDNGMLVCIMSDGTRMEVGQLPSGTGSCEPDDCECINLATDEDVTALLNAIGLYETDGLIQAVGLSVDGETIVIKNGILSVGEVDLNQITQRSGTEAIFDSGTSD